MKNILISIVVSLLLISCKKEVADPDLSRPSDSKKYPVKFNVSEFSQEIKEVPKGSYVSDAPLLFGHEFTYIAYDSAGTEVSRIKQVPSGETTRIVNTLPNEIDLGLGMYGVIQDSLGLGRHTIVMIATQNRIKVNTPSDDYVFNKFDQANFYFPRGGPISISRTGETFFKKFEINVIDGGSQQNVVLERVVAKVEFEILDSKSAMLYQFQFAHDAEAFRFIDETSFGDTQDQYKPNNEYEEYLTTYGENGPLFMSLYILNTNKPVDVTINAYDPYHQLVATKTIKEVSFEKNKRVILRGNMFSPAVKGLSSRKAYESYTEISF